MTDYKIPTDTSVEISNVYVLIRVAKAYSEAEFSLEIHADPWYLFDEGILDFHKNWLFAVSLERGREHDFWSDSSTDTGTDLDRVGFSESDLSESAGDESYSEESDGTASEEHDVSESAEYNSYNDDENMPSEEQDISDIIVEQNQLVLYRGSGHVEEAGKPSKRDSIEPKDHVRIWEKQCASGPY